MSSVPQSPLLITKYASDGDKADGIELVAQQSAHQAALLQQSSSSSASSPSAGHTVGIAHTRWATHGGKTDANAHPHVDSSGKIALVHNGTINNANELRQELQQLGHVFTSQTDTEVIAKLIGHYYNDVNYSTSSNSIAATMNTTTTAATEIMTMGNLKLATEYALLRCDGSWGLCIMCTDTPDELIVACNGSPLVIGITEDQRTFVASETAAFNRFTKNFISMNDGEIGILHSDGRTLDLSRTQLAPDQQVKLSPAPYPHWTIKECYEQPEAIARALGFGGRLGSDRVLLGGLDNNYERCSMVKHMTLSACGTSLNAARYGEKLMKHLGSFDTVQSIDAAETEMKDFPCTHGTNRVHVSNSNTGMSMSGNSSSNSSGGGGGRSTNSTMIGRIAVPPPSIAPSSTNPLRDTGLIVVSQSGETKDVVRVVKQAMDMDITTMSVVNAVGSLIARTTKMGVYCNAGRENAVASTKAFTTQVTVLALIALWYKQTRDRMEYYKNGNIPSASFKATQSVEEIRLKEALMRLPISFGMALKTHDQCKQIAAQLLHKEHCFVLGKGYGEPVAMEGALKIKEMCYLHAEGYSGGALKHGPFALIENAETGKFGATPIIMIILDDNHASHMRTAAEEVKARGAELIIITDKAELAHHLDPNPIIIPSNGPLTALGAVLPLQLIGYELALLKYVCFFVVVVVVVSIVGIRFKLLTHARCFPTCVEVLIQIHHGIWQKQLRSTREREGESVYQRNNKIFVKVIKVVTI
jgi:glutamine---fructose-6-phosphate transaminase (isomerizing)